MKDQNQTLLLVIGAIALVMFMNKPAAVVTPTVPATGGGGGAASGGGYQSADLCQLVDGSASFTANKMFLSGTAITTEWVRVLKQNGVLKDLGSKSLNSGTLSTDPNGKYLLYYGLNNSGAYYVTREEYTAPCQKAVDTKMGTLCAVGNVTVTVFDEYGNVQSATANPQAVTANEAKDITIRIRSPSDTCFGMPQSVKDNALCIKYNTTVVNTLSSSAVGDSEVPYVISSTYSAAGFGIKCFKLAKTKANEKLDIPIQIKSTLSGEPTTAHNMSVYVKDTSFDLNQRTYEEIYGFQDEDNNMLGTFPTSATIYIS